MNRQIKRIRTRLKMVRHRPKRWRQRGPLRPQAILLTATITPSKDVPKLSRMDPELRRRDYIAAFEWYLGLDSDLVDRIVFVENSGSPVADFEQMAAEVAETKDVEVMSLYGLDYPSNYERGYGEFKLLDATVNESRILRSLREDEPFWKLTGRYTLPNIRSVFENAPRSFDLYMNFRPSREFVDVRVLACTVNGYNRYLRGTYVHMSVERAEDHLYDVLMPRADEEGFVGAMNVVPRIEGLAAINNRQYGSGAERWTIPCRDLFSKVFPQMWY